MTLFDADLRFRFLLPLLFYSDAENRVNLRVRLYDSLNNGDNVREYENMKDITIGSSNVRF